MASALSKNFKGFFLKALRCGSRDFADHTGSFSSSSSGTKIICGNSGVTQTSSASSGGVSMVWQPTSNCSGCVDFWLVPHQVARALASRDLT